MMKKIVTIVFILSGITLLAQPSKSRVISNLDAGWKFALGDYPEAAKAGFNDTNWRTLDVPHDWSIELENNKDAPGGGSIGFFPTGTGWYRKTFDISKYDSNKIYSIEFDGVYMISEVWLNGVYLGKRPYGYSSFSYNLTGLLKSRNNVIAVRVDNSKQTNSRWYTGSGIYRHVRLVETSKLHFEKWSVFYYTKSIEENRAVIYLEAKVMNENNQAVQNVAIRNALLDQEGNGVTFALTPIPVNAKSVSTAEQEMKVKNPLLWSVESPNLYKLKSVILVDGKETDCVINKLGIRTIEYDVNKGFLLNGQQVKMEGREGQVVPVVCYTNCDTVELFLNGKSYGEKYLEFPRKGNTERWNKPEEGKVNTTTGDLHLSWDIVYETGELLAKGKKDGKEYTYRVVTADNVTLKATSEGVKSATVNVVAE